MRFQNLNKMEDVLKHLQGTQDKTKVQDIFYLLKVYVNNIVKNPTVAKYRKIRKSNPKFHSTIWSNEDARSFLFLAGFEEYDDFLVLPDGVHLDGAKTTLDIVDSNNSHSKTDHKTIPAASPQKVLSSNVLTLRGSTDSSMFDETVKADMTLLSYMKEMGFDVAVAEKALIITKNNGVQPAMDWINSNPGKVNEIQMAQFQPISTANETVSPEKIGDNDHAHPVATTSENLGEGPVSRYQTTIDERHRFQEKVRLEAIEAARLEKAEQKKQKEYLLKNLEAEKKERREKGERIKSMRMQDGSATTCETGETSHEKERGESDDNDSLSLRIRLPNGQITNLTLPSNSRLEGIYKQISSKTNLKEEEFVVMTVAPQTKLTEKETNLSDLGLKSQETLIVQRIDQAGSLKQGHGSFRQVLEVTTLGQWEEIQWRNKDQLIVAHFVSGSADCKNTYEEFETLNRKYGIEKQALFVQMNLKMEPAFKETYNIDIFPSYKLFWNHEILGDISGMDKDKLEKIILENLHGPVAERIANRESDYFDPR